MTTRVEKALSLYPSVGQRLRWLRCEMDLSQRPIAEHCGISPASLSQKERGVATFTRSEIANYLAYLTSRLGSVTVDVIDIDLTYDLIVSDAVDAPGIEMSAEVFGARLTLLRQFAGVSVEHMAKRMGCDVRSVYGWMRGEGLPSTSSAEKLCELMSECVDGFKPEMLVG